MSNLHAIRHLLTFVLAVAMTVQPFVGVAFAAGCCGHVGVEAAAASCGCCEGESTATCCCCGDETSVPAVGCCDSDVPASDDSEEGAAPQRLAGYCLCGLDEPPMHHGGERQRLGEQVGSHLAVHTPPAMPPVPHRMGSAAISSRSVALHGGRSDFSRRMFCVWLI